jgi:hypothetical protein
VGDKNSGANQAHHRCNHLDHCQTSFALPSARKPNDAQAYTVKNISRERRTIGIDWGFEATDAPKWSRLPVAGVARKQRSINQRKPHPISAVFRLRYLQELMRRWAASMRFLTGCCAKLGAQLVEW